MENGTLIPVQVIDSGMVPSNNHAERQPSHKATLYCSDCNHASRVNGDWIIHVHPGYLDYECPECGATIESRPDESDVIARSNGALSFGNGD
jgi:predicted RNA-binding Zn-ribbon protein involved in translation (DUF1610 family)